jgi:hypothetical protein
MLAIARFPESSKSLPTTVAFSRRTIDGPNPPIEASSPLFEASGLAREGTLSRPPRQDGPYRSRELRGSRQG